MRNFAESGARAVPLVAYAESGGGNKDTMDIFESLWKDIAKDEKFGAKMFQSITSGKNIIVNR